MRTTQNTKNSEYRIFQVAGGFEVWLTSCESGAKLAKTSSDNIFPNEQAAQEFTDWVKIQEIKYNKDGKQ